MEETGVINLQKQHRSKRGPPGEDTGVCFTAAGNVEAGLTSSAHLSSCFLLWGIDGVGGLGLCPVLFLQLVLQERGDAVPACHRLLVSELASLQDLPKSPKQLN